ncbi:MAG: hypothetical protein ABJA98_03370 [Acidobacteriota bacterium]
MKHGAAVCPIEQTATGAVTHPLAMLQCRNRTYRMTIELAKEGGGLAGFSGLPIDINRSDLLLAEQKPAPVRERPRVLGSAQPLSR